MKKSIYLIFIFVIIIMLVSCKGNNKSITKTSSNSNYNSTLSSSSNTTSNTLTSSSINSIVSTNSKIQKGTDSKSSSSKTLKSTNTIIDITKNKPIGNQSSKANTSSKSPTNSTSQYDKTPLPLISYTKSDNPLQVLNETINRTNKCKMYDITSAIQYHDYDKNYSQRVYTQSFQSDIGININKNKIFEYNCYNYNFPSNSSNGYYRGFIIGDNYIVNKNDDYNYYDVGKDNYNKIFSYINSKPLNFDMPLQDEIISSKIQDSNFTTNGDKIELEFEMNEKYFNRGITVYKSISYDENPINFKYIKSKITASANEYGIIRDLKEETTYTYQVNDNGNLKEVTVNLVFDDMVRDASNYRYASYTVPDELRFLFD